MPDECVHDNKRLICVNNVVKDFKVIGERERGKISCGQVGVGNFILILGSIYGKACTPLPMYPFCHYTFFLPTHIHLLSTFMYLDFHYNFLYDLLHKYVLVFSWHTM